MSQTPDNKMGRWGAISYILGQVIGSGIFITPTGILNYVQSVGASMLIWVVAGLIATLGAFCYIELGTAIRKSGCDFAYLCHMRWTAFAFAFMTCSCIFNGPGSMAIEAATFTEYFVKGIKVKFCDPATEFITHKLISFSIMLLLVFLNCFSIRSIVSRFQIVSMIAKLIACGIIIAAGLLIWTTQGVQSDNFRDPFANSNFALDKVVLALYSGLFSYGGWEILNMGIEDIKHPHKVMPFSIIVGMTTIASVYLAMNLSYFIILSVPKIQETNAIAMTFSEHIFHGFLQYLMPFLVCTVQIGSMNATLFASSRMLWAISREGYFPPFISCINRQHDSPRAALFVHIFLAMAFSFVGNLNELIGYVESTNWIMRCFTMVALLCIRFGHRANGIHEKTIRMPLILPIAFLIISLSLVLITVVRTFGSVFIGILILIIGLFIYLALIWPLGIRRFACFRLFSHKINNAMAFAAQIVFDGQIEQITHSETEPLGLLNRSDKKHFLTRSKRIVPTERELT